MKSEKSPTRRSLRRCSTPPLSNAWPDAGRAADPVGRVRRRTQPHLLAEQVHEIELGEVTGADALPRQRRLDKLLEVPRPESARGQLEDPSSIPPRALTSHYATHIPPRGIDLSGR